MFTLTQITDLLGQSFKPESGEDWNRINDTDPHRFGQQVTGVECLTLTSQGTLTAIIPLRGDEHDGPLKADQKLDRVFVYAGDTLVMTACHNVGLEILATFA